MLEEYLKDWDVLGTVRKCHVMPDTDTGSTFLEVSVLLSTDPVC